ncbi:transposase domain-containing protein, partial [Escherichia coli]|nr:transposase domain-containing protein [Escherichia coli]
PESISVILFNSRFRSYGAQGVLKKHPFCGAFLVFWGFKFLSMNGIDPEAYLRHILSVLPEWPSNRVDELLPWNVVLSQ